MFTFSHRSGGGRGIRALLVLCAVAAALSAFPALGLAQTARATHSRPAAHASACNRVISNGAASGRLLRFSGTTCAHARSVAWAFLFGTPGHKALDGYSCHYVASASRPWSRCVATDSSIKFTGRFSPDTND